MHDDWQDLLAGLHAAKARYLVVGAHAMAVHGVPRGTQDIDLWIEATRGNAEKIWQVLIEFGAPLESLGISLGDLYRPDTVVQLGVPPNRVDLLTSISGVPDFQAAWVDRVESDFGGVSGVAFLGRQALVRSKRAAGRRKDLADLEALGELPPA
ncbi:MAG: hypothetical protein U0974_00155 [Gemmatimonadales bacterium]|nr:hypothetical protein [Gemmatimonadales bacterium]MDZ4388131.1 hypothetical protein [Gemmatimonadales bacterium]